MSYLTESGSIYSCGIHGINTDNPEIYLEHMYTVDGHYEIGTSECIYCKCVVVFDLSDKLKKTPEYTAPAICPECAESKDIKSNCKSVKINKEIGDCK